MAKEIIMPKFGFTQEDSTIVAWLKGEGDVVEKGEPIAEVTTDKVNMEVEAPEDGVLGGIRYGEGDVVPVTEIIAYVLAEGEEAPAAAPKTAPAAAAEAAPEPAAKPEAPAPAPSAGGPVTVTPVARRMAEAEGVDLSQVAGSGPGGKITRQDVEAFAAEQRRPGAGKVRATPAARRAAREEGVSLEGVEGSGPRGRVQAADVAEAAQAAPAAPAFLPGAPVISATPAEAQVIPLEGMRRTIAERMQASYQQAPHIMLTMDIDMGRAIELRTYANDNLPDGHPRVSMTAVIVRAVAWALRQHPMMNAAFTGAEIIVQPVVNVGVAVALPDGLIVPVVHDADRKGLLQIGADVAAVAERARTGKLRGDDLADGTFTVSNLGMYGIDHFTAILNPPQVGILAVGQTAQRFVPDENGQPVARPLMTVTLSCDHRVVDGAVGAQFLATLRDALEEPSRLLL